MENLWQKYGGSIHFVIVNTRETASNFENWLDGQDQIWTYNGTDYNIPGLVGGVTFPALHGPSIIWNYLSGSYSWPVIYIIGADSRVKSIHDQGTLYTESELEGHILDVVYQRSPVSVDLVADVSSSMLSPPSGSSGDNKLTLLQQALNIVLDVIVTHGQSDDTVGLTRFSDNASDLQFAGKKLIAMNQISHVRDGITALTQNTGTCTAIGAGLQTAFDTLVAEATHDRFAILCTDGMQNIEPKVTNAGSQMEIRNSGGWLCGPASSVPEKPGIDITTYDTRVHTIGIGATANYESLLQDLADHTGGFYRGTNDPQNDLDLIYTVSLCNCLAKGSPAVVCHRNGILHAKQCQAVETFPVNRTARKMSVLLSWQNGQNTNLTFWLHAPDGTLLKLDGKLKVFENYCMATIYLPVQQHEKELPFVGQWTMVIRGEMEGGNADYHAMVIVEDREVKYTVDYPRKAYAVGDILPLKMKVKESKEPVTRIAEIVMEHAEPRVPVAEILANYKVSLYELRRSMMCERASEHTEALIHEKLQALEKNPKYRELLSPARKTFALSNGSLECRINEGEIIIPIAFKQPGLHSFKLTVQCETPESGPICRTEIVSVLVGAGPVDPKKSFINLSSISGKKAMGAILYLTPKTAEGKLLGPGLAGEIKATRESKSLAIKVTDHLDGTYQIEIPAFKKTAKRKTPVTVRLQAKTVWKGEVNGP